MAQSVKVGTPIFEEDFRRTVLPTLMDLGIDDDPMKVDENAVQKLMAKEAMKAVDKDKNHAIELVNGFKDDWGLGVSTRVMVYNGLGIPLAHYQTHDTSGYWSPHTLDDRIEVGEWAIGFHHKSSGSATGSCGVVSYKLLGYGHDDVLMIGFETPWSGQNRAYCAVTTTKKWASTSWDKVDGWVSKGPVSGTNDFGRARVKFNTDNSSSPTLEVVVTRSDIGY